MPDALHSSLGLGHRHGRRLRDEGRFVLLLFCLAVTLYVAGFRLAAFTWVDAIGTATAHAAPGAALGWAAWRLQPRLPPRLWLHVLAAILMAALWLGAVFAITAVARPEIVWDVTRRALEGTLASGVVLYAAVALSHALWAARRRADRLAVASSRAELASLRGRIEPHFLYNTLESVAALVASDPAAAERAIGRLGRMLRRVFDQPEAEDGEALVPVREEMQLVRDYLAIEALRLGPRLRVIERLGPGVEDLLLPAFTLQVLVENAIIHGIRRAEPRCRRPPNPACGLSRRLAARLRCTSTPRDTVGGAIATGDLVLRLGSNRAHD